MRRAAAYSVTAGCLAVMIWAVSFGTLPPADFIFSNLGEIKTVDPHLVTGNTEGRIVWSIFEGLTSWDPKDLTPRPGVAEAWDISDDKLTYTFHLRPDAKWSDGSPVVADDFAWSFRRFLHPETAAEYAVELWYVVGAKKYTTAAVEVGDPVEIELDEKPPGARPFASGVILRGTLLAVDNPPAGRGGDGDDSAANKTYVVEIDGNTRRFRQGASSADTEDYKWLLYDFESVGIRALDRRTLQIRLKHPVPYFINLMGFYPMSPVNRRCVETHGYPAWTKPENVVTNGPFILKFRRIRDRIRLVKNPYYWDRDNVKLEVVDALAVASYPTNLNLYMTGQADWIPVVPLEVVPDLLKRKHGDFKPEPYLGSYHYLVNTSKPPLDDKRVRQALNLAMDKREITEKITRAGQTPARSLVPRSIARWVDYTPAECGPHDVKRARQLLAEAGYPGGRGFPKIEILYNTSEAHQAIAELIQSQWKRRLGVDVGLRNQAWPAYLSSRRQGDYHVARAGWIADYADPVTFLDMFTGDSPLNQTRWDHPDYDRLLEQARQEPDEAKRMQHLEEAERILMDELPVLPIYAYVSQNMIRPYVRGFHANIQDVHPLKAIWIDHDLKQKVLREEGLR